MKLVQILISLAIIVKSSHAFRNSSISFVKHNSDTSVYIILSFYIIAVSSVKILYTSSKIFSKFIPESNLLLICGIIIGFLFTKVKEIGRIETVKIFEMKSNTFFYILLPPIVLESSFAIYHKTFASNLVGVLIFAVIGTLLNFFTIAIGLLILVDYNCMDLTIESINRNTIWIFSSLIVAVDPVAVLGIFQEIHVDNNLYYLVFGESLLNDGVSVVLYDVMIEMSDFETVTINDIFRAIVSFTLVGIGGGSIGFFISIITCILTRFTVKTPLIEPIIVITFGYLSYLLANAISWSGIISMIVYGVIQAAYGFANITSKSLILIKRLSKILSSLSESIIFLSLGVTLTSININYKSSFMLWSLFLCIYCRFVFTIIQSTFINYFQFNIRKIKWNEQFIIAYGGLRGGIAFCLAELIKDNIDADKQAIRQTTVVIVVFTIFVMGFTMKPLVTMLRIQIAKPDEICLFIQISESAIGHLLAGVEEIIGLKGRNALNEFMTNIDELYIRPLLQRDQCGRDEKIMKVYERMNMTMHMATTTAGTPRSDYYLHKLKPHLRNMMEHGRHDISTTGLSIMNDEANASSIEMSRRLRLRVQSRESIDQNIFMPQRRISNGTSTFAHRMSAMIFRKRRSLAMTNLKHTQIKRLSRISKITNESDTEGKSHRKV